MIANEISINIFLIRPKNIHGSVRIEEVSTRIFCNPKHQQQHRSTFKAILMV